MMTYRTIYLVRHGQYDPDQGKDNPLGSDLTEIGAEQSELTARYLAQYPISAIYSSNLLRATHSAEIIARPHTGLSVTSSDLLGEITPPLPYLVLKYVRGISNEQLNQDREQGEKAFRNFFCPAVEHDEFDVIVCHGNLIRFLVCRALQVSPFAWLSFEIYNCSISAVEIDQYGNTLLLSYNESGHLPEQLKSQNLYPMGIGFKKRVEESRPQSAEGEIQTIPGHREKG